MTEQEIQHRIDEIDQDLKETLALKRNNRVSMEDEEDISYNYQMNLEWNYYIDELNAERKELIKQRNSFHHGEEVTFD